jgi:multidrug efflux pump subunit AcrB
MSTPSPHSVTRHDPIRASARRRWASCIALLFAGIIASRGLPLATRTTVELPACRSARLARVGRKCNGLTSPIEAAIQGVRGVKRVSSVSNDDFDAHRRPRGECRCR